MYEELPYQSVSAAFACSVVDGKYSWIREIFVAVERQNHHFTSFCNLPEFELA